MNPISEKIEKFLNESSSNQVDVEKKNYTKYDTKEPFSIRHVRFGKKGIDGGMTMHPEHWNKIKDLKPNEEHKFRDETKTNWSVKRSEDGNHVHFKSLGSEGLSGKYPHAEFMKKLG